MLNVQKIKRDFPIFQKIPNLIYLDSTATSLKPREVMKKGREYYENYGANIFRGIYSLSERATEAYEETRKKMAKLINAYYAEEVIFTKNTTESINLIVFGLARYLIKKDDEILVTMMEHHSNFVPWQMLCQEKKAKFRVVGVEKDNGFLDFVDFERNNNLKINMDKLKKWVTKKTRFFSLTSISNVLGTINPIKEIIKAVKEINKETIIIIDGAQALPHQSVNVQDLGIDFFVGSSHKMLGPTGVGILWGRLELLRQMRPVFYGGEMVEWVSKEKSIFQNPPYRFEAGTPAIAQVVALGTAIDYLIKIGFKNIENHEKELVRYAFDCLKKTFGEKIKILGKDNILFRSGIISFNLRKIHPHDLAHFLGQKNICVRSGHHCAMPLHQFYRINGSVRASFYLYNDFSDIDKLILNLKKAINFF